MDKVYRAYRIGRRLASVQVRDGGPLRHLDSRFDLRFTEQLFDWGKGAGEWQAVQLALSLVADATGDDRLAVRVCRRVMRRLVCGLPRDGWALEARQVRELAGDLSNEDEDLAAESIFALGRR